MDLDIFYIIQNDISSVARIKNITNETELMAFMQEAIVNKYSITCVINKVKNNNTGLSTTFKSLKLMKSDKIFEFISKYIKITKMTKGIHTLCIMLDSHNDYIDTSMAYITNSLAEKENTSRDIIYKRLVTIYNANNKDNCVNINMYFNKMLKEYKNYINVINKRP